MGGQLAQLRSRDTAPARLSALYLEVRGATEALCSPLAIEDYVAQSMPDASPTKWHLAHTSWFFEEFVLRAFAPELSPDEPQYRILFNSYYQAVGPMHERAQRGLLTRPTVEEILRYRARIDAAVAELLERADDEAHEEIVRRISLGLHHEQQHQELLLTDIKHLFSCNPLRPAYAAASRTGGIAPPLQFRSIAGGIVQVGSDGEGFCFDNETPRHGELLQPFELASRPVTNAEFREFVLDGGYTNPLLWLADGWGLVQRERWRRPLYWSESLDEEFTLGGMRPLQAEAPVCHLSYYEADAFARWSGARLPREAEWEHVAASQPVEGNFVERAAWHPLPAPAEGARSAGGTFAQLYGDVWEWTQSAHAPYPGYRPAAGALGEYNGKFMVNQLVLRGGSCVTPRTHVRATYRNFFPPGARWQFSGLRLARDAR